jgi:hypothetical protein
VLPSTPCRNFFFGPLAGSARLRREGISTWKQCFRQPHFEIFFQSAQGSFSSVRSGVLAERPGRVNHFLRFFPPVRTSRSGEELSSRSSRPRQLLIRFSFFMPRGRKLPVRRRGLLAGRANRVNLKFAFLFKPLQRKLSCSGRGVLAGRPGGVNLKSALFSNPLCGCAVRLSLSADEGYDRTSRPGQHKKKARYTFYHNTLILLQ